MRLRIVGAIALGAVLLMGGCISSQSQEVKAGPGVGQELQELEDARDKGLITESEYQKQRKRILEK